MVDGLAGAAGKDAVGVVAERAVAGVDVGHGRAVGRNEGHQLGLGASVVRQRGDNVGTAVVDFLARGAGQLGVCVEVGVIHFVDALALERGGEELAVSPGIGTVTAVNEAV